MNTSSNDRRRGSQPVENSTNDSRTDLVGAGLLAGGGTMTAAEQLGISNGVELSPDDYEGDEKVNHLFSVRAMRLASEMGVEMRSLCGRKWSRPVSAKYAANPDTVGKNEDGTVSGVRERDCKLCLRVVRSW